MDRVLTDGYGTACPAEGWRIWTDVSWTEDKNSHQWNAGDYVHGAVEIGNGLVGQAEKLKSFSSILLMISMRYSLGSRFEWPAASGLD